MLGHWGLEGAVSGARPGSRVQKVANIVFEKAGVAGPFSDQAIYTLKSFDRKHDMCRASLRHGGCCDNLPG